MSLKIYREINNNNSNNNDKNILLEFVCNIDLWNATDIFDVCLHYDSDEGEFTEVSEVYSQRLNDCLGILKYHMENYRHDNAWLQEAQRCYDILSKELNGRENGFYMLFVL